MTPAAWECGEVASCAEMATRVECVRKAARWVRIAATEMADDAEFALRWAATWRAAGKALPRRIGMAQTRARRRYRRRPAARVTT